MTTISTLINAVSAGAQRSLIPSIREAIAQGQISGAVGVAQSSVTTTATSEAPIRAGTYNEPTTNAIRSFSSSSANDAAAGTGLRTALVTFYTWAGTTLVGPFTETITLNGVATVDTASAWGVIESVEFLTAGAGGTYPAGTITFFNASGGGGGTLATITAGLNGSRWGHHYVPSGFACVVTDIMISGTTAGIVAGGYRLRSTNYALGSTAFGQLMTGSLVIQATATTAVNPRTWNPQAGWLAPSVSGNLGNLRINANIVPSAVTSTSWVSEFAWMHF